MGVRSLNNSSKSMTSCGRVGLGLAGRGCVAPSSVLERGMRVGGRWDALRPERQLESEIMLTGAAISTPLAEASSRRSSVPKEVHQSTKSNRSKERLQPF